MAANTQTADRQRQQQAPQQAPQSRPPAARQQQQPPQQQNRVAVAQQNYQARLSALAHDMKQWEPAFRSVLPKHIDPNHFARVVITAALKDPELALADRQSLYQAALKCAHDGLVPDGRLAAFVVYNTEVKRRDPDTRVDYKIRIDQVQYMPMIQGIRQRMHNTGEVISAEAEVVYKNDTFKYRLGDDGYIEHDPAPLDSEPGEIVGAYAIIRLKNGQIIRDVMRKRDIEAARGQSKASGSLMWTKFYGEAARKTVLRRASKQAPATSDLVILDDDEDRGTEIAGEYTEISGALPPMETAAAPEPEPERQPDTSRRDPAAPPAPAAPTFDVLDLDGVVTTFGSGMRAYDAARLLMNDAESNGRQRLDGWWEDNQPLLEALNNNQLEGPASELLNAYLAAQQRIADRENAASQQQAKPAETETSPPVDQGAAPAPVGDDRFPGDLASGEKLNTATAAPATQQPPAGEPQERQSKKLKMPMAGNKPNGHAFLAGLAIPGVRRCRSTEELAWFLGDNEENIAIAKQSATVADVKDFDETVANQWNVIAKLEAPAS